MGKMYLVVTHLSAANADRKTVIEVTNGTCIPETSMMLLRIDLFAVGSFFRLQV